MWAYESVFYQIYPLGFCGAPFENDGVSESRILKVNDWIPHMKKIGINAVYFSPVFESDTHGYNTRDYHKIDCRLGTNEDFAAVCKNLHENGIKVVLDGVFNHVGRGFWAFQDVLQKRWDSPYKDWFHINFDGNSNYNDGLWYEGWEGNYDLVKLNLHNEEVVNYLLESVKFWVANTNAPITPIAGTFLSRSSNFISFTEYAAAAADTAYIVPATAGDTSASAICIITFLLNHFILFILSHSLLSDRSSFTLLHGLPAD